MFVMYDKDTGTVIPEPEFIEFVRPVHHDENFNSILFSKEGWTMSYTSKDIQDPYYTEILALFRIILSMKNGHHYMYYVTDWHDIFYELSTYREYESVITMEVIIDFPDPRLVKGLRKAMVKANVWTIGLDMLSPHVEKPDAHVFYVFTCTVNTSMNIKVLKQIDRSRDKNGRLIYNVGNVKYRALSKLADRISKRVESGKAGVKH